MKQALNLFLILLLIHTFLYYPSANAKESDASWHLVFDVLPLNLEEITKKAEKIFAGKCVRKEIIENDLVAKVPVVKYTFKITEPIKGVGSKKRLVFKQWQATSNQASYDIGKKYVVFLHANSDAGLTSPIGFSQGQFDVLVKEKEEYVVNKLNNIGLTKNIKTRKSVTIKNKTINDYVHNASNSGQPIRYADFVYAVEELVGK